MKSRNQSVVAVASRVIREHVGARPNTPIEVTSGSHYGAGVVTEGFPPCLVGKPPHYVNAQGKRIAHPSAHRRAMGDVTYRPSTIRVCVDADTWGAACMGAAYGKAFLTIERATRGLPPKGYALGRLLNGKRLVTIEARELLLT